MPSGRPLDEHDKRLILRMRSAGQSNSYIARTLNMSRTTVIAFLSRWDREKRTFISHIDK